MNDFFYTLFRLQGEQDWQPQINMFESELEVWIEVELPGMDKDQICILKRSTSKQNNKSQCS